MLEWHSGLEKPGSKYEGCICLVIEEYKIKGKYGPMQMVEASICVYDAETDDFVYFGLCGGNEIPYNRHGQEDYRCYWANLEYDLELPTGSITRDHLEWLFDERNKRQEREYYEAQGIPNREEEDFWS